MVKRFLLLSLCIISTTYGESETTLQEISLTPLEETVEKPIDIEDSIQELQDDSDTTVMPDNLRILSSIPCKKWDYKLLHFSKNIQYCYIVVMHLSSFLQLGTISSKIFNTPFTPSADIVKVVNLFGYDASKFNFIKNPLLGMGAIVSKNTIRIGSTLLEKASSDQLKFVVSHEVAHFHFNHQLKRYALMAGIILGQIALHKYVHYAKSKYNPEQHPYLHKFIRGYDFIHTILYYNPLLRVMLSGLIIANYAQFQEKQADLEAIRRLQDAMGGIQFFSSPDVPDITTITKGFSPSLKAFITLFTSHPSNAERIAYMTEAAQKYGYAV